MLEQASRIRGEIVEYGDSRLGEIDDLLFDAYRWRVHFLVLREGSLLSTERFLLVHQRHLLPGPTRRMPASWSEHLDWDAHCVRVAATGEDIRRCPEYDADASASQMLDRS